MLFVLPLLLSVGLLSLLIGGDETAGGDDDAPRDDTDRDDHVDDLPDGTDGPDRITGTDQPDTIYGLAGFDEIAGGEGEDALYGGLGKDLLEGDGGNDVLNGDNWNDGLFGGAGDDALYGGSSNDILVGGTGFDDLYGESGDDVLLGGDAGDELYGDDGDDLLAGSQVFNRDLTPEDYAAFRDGTLPRDEDEEYFEDWGLTGTDGDDSTDILNGGAGDDTFIIGNNDVVTGGTGQDDFILGDWISADNVAVITDFNSREDILFVALEDNNVDADIRTEENFDGDGQFLFINGALVANIQGTFDTLDGIDADIITVTYTATPAG